MPTQIDLPTRVMNVVVTTLMRRGVSVIGARELVTTGRVSHRPRTTPVNVLVMDDTPHLVSPRGQTDWVRNVRADPRVTVRLGRTEQRYHVVELSGAATVPVLRAYLRRWGWEIKRFLPPGISSRSSDAELETLAADLPVFRLERW